MPSVKSQLCSRLMLENFGEVVQNISDYLIAHGSSTLRVIVKCTGIKPEQVKKALCTLLQHNIAFYEENKKEQVEYGVNTDKILMRIRYPQFVYYAKTLYGDAAELLIEELLENGQLQMSVVIQKVKERLENDEAASDKVSLQAIKEKFVYLAKTHFIQRCPVVDPTQDETTTGLPRFEIGTIDVYQVPQVDLASLEQRKRKLSSTEGTSAPPTKKLKIEKEQNQPDENIYWMVNYARFDEHMRDQALILATARKIDKKAGDILRTLLRLSETKSDNRSPMTNAVSYNELYQAMSREGGFSKPALDQYLKLITEDSMDFVKKTEESGGGMYCINFQKAFHTLAKAHIESVIQERFGSKCLRVFRLLILKKHLEQKQIEEKAMIPSKEAKEMLYSMFGENFIHLTEVPRTPDYAPSRTFYLFSVNLNQVSRMVLERCYQGLYNVMLRREHETKDHRRILDKQQRVEAITASLEQQGADEQQKAEVEEMITPAERTQLAKVKHITKKLELSEMQIDDTIFILKTFIHYDGLK